MDKNYQYREREEALDTANQFRLGEGKISGYCSIALGFLSLLAVIAYLYPAYLTTIELRQIYDAEELQQVLKYGMYFSLFFGCMTFVLNGYKRLGATGIVLTLLAFAFGGYNIPVGPVEPVRLSLGVDWLILAFLGSTLVFTTLEKLFPKYKQQIILRDEWGLDLFYFCLNHLMISVIIIYANHHAAHFSWAINPELQATIQSVPVIVQFLIIFVCADFVLYWEHRLYHEVSALWPIHAVHHSVEHMDWLAGSRGHFIQVFSERALVVTPLFLLGASQDAINIYITIAALQAILIHCNLKVPLGPLKYIFVTPQFHHWHHSSEKTAIDTNYAAHLVIFDKLFGTYHMPKGKWPADFGTTNRLPRTFWKQVLYPITAFFDGDKSK